MSDALQPPNPIPDRALRQEERELIYSLLSGVLAKETLDSTLSAARVRDLQDGKMGSIRFVRAEPQRFGKVLAEREYEDSDGVLVSIAVNADHNDQLFELDFWKVDFSPLRRYPKPSDLVPE